MIQPRRATPGPPSRGKNTFAVVVGVEKYAAGAEWNLDGPATDACRFVKWLRERGVPPAQVLLFLSPLDGNQPLAQQLDLAAQPAEHGPVTKALTDVLHDKAGELLIFFWGGHGVIDAKGNRRLFYADATEHNLRHLSLNSLMTCWRTDFLSGFRRQMFFVDACANFVEQMKPVAALPEERFPEGMPVQGLEQFALLAASPGELAKNQAAQKSGAFSAALFAELPKHDQSWPPDLAQLNRALMEHFAALRDAGEANQTPAHFWYRDWQGSTGTFGTLARPAAGGQATSVPPLGVAERMELTSALVACALLKDNQSRDSIVNDLRPEISNKIPRDSRVERDVDGMVRTALNYPGGLKELVYIVRTYEGDSLARQALDQVVSRLLPGLI